MKRDSTEPVWKPAAILTVLTIVGIVLALWIRSLSLPWYNPIVDNSAPMVELRSTVQAMQTQIAGQR